MRLGIYANISNLYHSINRKFPGYKLHYDKYLKAILEDERLTLYKAYAYGVRRSINEASSFIKCLQMYGYEPKFYNRGYDYNWNTGISIDIINDIEQVDMIVIGSNDLSLIPLLDWIKMKNKELMIYACHVSGEIKENYPWKEITIDLLENQNNDNNLINSDKTNNNT